MQIVVIGAGNMGCVYGGNRARLGLPVCLVDTRRRFAFGGTDRGPPTWELVCSRTPRLARLCQLFEEADPVAAIQEYCSHKFHRPSMMQHLDRGQQTEIDALNGYVARESRRLGLAAPYSEALAAIIAGRQHHPLREVVE